MFIWNFLLVVFLFLIDRLLILTNFLRLITLFVELIFLTACGSSIFLEAWTKVKSLVLLLLHHYLGVSLLADHAIVKSIILDFIIIHLGWDINFLAKLVRIIGLDHGIFFDGEDLLFAGLRVFDMLSSLLRAVFSHNIKLLAFFCGMVDRSVSFSLLRALFI